MSSPVFFRVSLENYFYRYFKYLLIIGISSAGSAILVYVLLKAGRTADPQRIHDLLKFINVVDVLMLLFVGVLAGKRIYRGAGEYGNSMWGQPLIVAMLIGTVYTTVKSIISFIVTLISGQVFNAIIDLISFLWRTWGYAALTAVAVYGLIVFIWFRSNKATIQEKIKEAQEDEDQPKP